MCREAQNCKNVCECLKRARPRDTEKAEAKTELYNKNPSYVFKLSYAE